MRIISKLYEITKDKYLHFIAGIIIASICVIILNLNLFCIIPTAIIGVAKEVYDYLSYGKFDCMDLLYTVLGGLLIFLMSLLNLIVL
jgi:hypothetical protein